MSSTLNPTKTDPKVAPTAAPDMVVTRADHDVAKPQPTGKSAPAVAHKGADPAASAKAPPVDTTFAPHPPNSVKESVGPSVGRRLMRGVIGMIVTAIVAGAVMLWQSNGDAVRQIVLTKSVSPIITALVSRISPVGEQPSAAPEVQAAAVPEAPASQQPGEQPADNLSSSAAGQPAATRCDGTVAFTGARAGPHEAGLGPDEGRHRRTQGHR